MEALRGSQQGEAAGVYDMAARWDVAGLISDEGGAIGAAFRRMEARGLPGLR